MSIAVALDGAALLGVPDVTEREQLYQGTLTLSGNYGTGSSHGDTLSFANLVQLLVGTKTLPLRVEIYEQPAAGTAPSFYEAVYQIGTTRDNGAVNFSLAGVEYTEGSAYSGAIAAAVWKFRAWFPKGQ